MSNNHNLNSLNPMKFLEMGKIRGENIEKASSETPNINKNANVLANRLHPKCQHLLVDKIIEEPNSKRYILIPNNKLGTNELAYFSSGQYLSIEIEIDGKVYNRPYTIASSPKESLNCFYEILVKRVPNGVVSNYILDNWTVGTNVKASDPCGNFTYEKLRDEKNIIGIAGGSGITPFISLARSIFYDDKDINLTIIYGCKKEEEILYKKELDMYSYTNCKINVVYVLSDEEKSNYEYGFINEGIIRKYAYNKYSLFICGPAVMHEYLDNELPKLNLEKKYIRHEVHSTRLKLNEIKAFNIKVLQKNKVFNIKCNSNQTLLESFEANNIKSISRCRSGECGFCHSKLISGEIFIPKANDLRRKADDLFNYVHPCCSYPLSDIEIEIK